LCILDYSSRYNELPPVAIYAVAPYNRKTPSLQQATTHTQKNTTEEKQ